MDWDVIASYLPQYEKAAWLTLRLGVIGIVWAIGIGLVCAVLQYDKVPVLRRLVGAYIQLSRHTPLLSSTMIRNGSCLGRFRWKKLTHFQPSVSASAGMNP